MLSKRNSAFLRVLAITVQVFVIMVAGKATSLASELYCPPKYSLDAYRDWERSNYISDGTSFISYKIFVFAHGEIDNHMQDYVERTVPDQSERKRGKYSYLEWGVYKVDLDPEERFLLRCYYGDDKTFIQKIINNDITKCNDKAIDKKSYRNIIEVRCVP